jgi:hypothetical protein
MDLNVRPGTIPRVTRAACLAFGLAGLLVGNGWAAATPIYKCLDRNLGLLYTDQPCKEGEQLDIRAGDADPAAVARLDRERDALDQSAAQRIANDSRYAFLAGREMGMGYGPPEEGGPYDDGAAFISGFGFASNPFLPHHPKKPRRSKSNPSNPMPPFAPHPPLGGAPRR